MHLLKCEVTLLYGNRHSINLHKAIFAKVIGHSADEMSYSFMVQLVSRLHESVYNSKRSNRKKYQEWNRIEATLSRQMTLRMLSSIQIASKMHNYHNVSAFSLDKFYF